MDEEGHEDVEAELGVGVVCGVGDEAFGELMESDGDGGLKADGEEGVGGNMMVVLGFDVFLFIIVVFRVCVVMVVVVSMIVIMVVPMAMVVRVIVLYIVRGVVFRDPFKWRLQGFS